jgi:mannose/fructose/N-acetylgalactosamine-specific phosphotransferase system component IIC
MLFQPDAFLLLLVLGGLVAVDGTSFGQFMISRPLVAATLAGFLVGDPFHGAVIGLILEVFHLTVLPVGAAKYPEGGPAAVVGGAVYATSNLAPSTLLVTVLLVLLLEWVGGESVRYLRKANIALVSGERISTPRKLEQRHLLAIGLDFLRGMVLVAGGAILMGTVVPLAAGSWGLGERIPQLVLTVALISLLAAATRVVGLRLWLTAAGAAAAALLLLLAP